MAHVTPFVLVAGRSLSGHSLGFHAYSVRVDNITNQWLQEESTLTWIPPYSLGVVVRLWGTSVALVLNQAPQGQPQLAPVVGEYAVVVFSDEMRTENPGVPVRQFTYVQAVSDLTEGPQPIAPNVGVDRLWADTIGLIHHLHSNGVDTILVDPLQTGVVTSGMILDGTIATADLAGNAVVGVPVQYGPTLPTFSTTTTGVWVNTPISLTMQSIGQGLVRVCGVVNWAHSVAGGAALWALNIDGSIVITFAFQHEPFANGGLQSVLEWIGNTSAASHTYTVQVQNLVAGTVSLSANANCSLSATEYKR